jgi:hypothetical protein
MLSEIAAYCRWARSSGIRECLTPRRQDAKKKQEDACRIRPPGGESPNADKALNDLGELGELGALA